MGKLPASHGFSLVCHLGEVGHGGREVIIHGNQDISIHTGIIPDLNHLDNFSRVFEVVFVDLIGVGVKGW